MKKLFLFILLFFDFAIGFTQTIPPPYINYQAILYDVNGPNPNAPFALQSFPAFVNLNDELGNLLYREEHFSSTDANGQVTIKIGDGLYLAGPITNFNQIPWQTGKYYLVVEFDINGTLSATAPEQLVTVPYAFYSGKSGSGISGIADNGNGTLTFTYNDGTTYTSPALSGLTGPQGPEGFLSNGSSPGNTPYWNGSQWILNGANLFNNGDAIGIGTTAPNASAIADINSSTKGLLIPRMTTVQRNAIANPADGLIIFNTSSGCLNYFYNSTWFKLCGLEPTAPAAPIFVSSNPVGPSNSSTTPTLIVNSSVGNTIELYANGICSGLPVASGVVGPGGSVAIPVSVSSNSTTVFTATATDTEENVSACSSSFAYTHDNIQPNPITIVSSTPIGPSNSSTTPFLNITGGEPGSTVKIYKTSNCTGTVAATGIISAGGTASIQVAVTSNATTQLTATATDAAGNVSACSNVFSYTHDNVPPGTPVIVSSTPASPGNTVTPSLNLTGSAFTNFSIYANGSGTGIPIATGTFNGFGQASIVVTVTANATTTLSAKSVDAAGNVSAVSAPFNYTHVP